MDKIFNKPFAVNGARVAIPENGTENERVSFDKGFTQPYEVEAPSVDNPSGQGFNILRPEMNEALYQLSLACNTLAENIDKWTLLTTENLNDIKQAGRYFQNLNINATDERNYPANIAGYLIVLNNGIGSYGVTQIYKIWNSERIYIRRTTSTTDWSNWDSLVLTSEYNTQITQLQNTDTNLNNNKEDKTKFTNGIINNTTNSNLDNLTQNGFYWRKSNQGSPLPTNNGGAVIVNTDGAQVIQYFYTDIWISSSASGAWFRTRNAGGTWTDWHHLENSEHAEATYRKIADSYTKAQCDSTFLTIANANSTYRTIADSYTKAQCDSTFLTKTLASSTYRTIADSYSKSEVNTRTPSLVLSKIGFTYSNIQNATFTIPNNSFLKTCNIQIMFRIRHQNNNTITFNFKNGNSVVASRVFERSSVSSYDYDVNDYISGLASFSITSALLGKTITPSISVTNTQGKFLLNEVDLLITYGS